MIVRIYLFSFHFIISFFSKLIEFLEKEYKWSSYLDYIKINNFSSVTERNFMLEIMGGENGCKDFIENWVMYKKELSEFSNLFLE